MPIIPTTADDSALRVVSSETVHVEWEIHTFFDRKYGNNEYFMSPTFIFCGATWCIRAYPNDNNNVELGLRKEISPKKFPVSVAIGIKKGKESVFKSFYTRLLFQKDVCLWYAPVFPSSELLQCQDLVAPNGVLTIFLNLRTPDEGSSDDVAVEAACQTLSNGFDTLSRDFKELFLGDDNGDVTFMVKDKKFLAHRLVLTTRSTVFSAMFETDMVEKNNGAVNISDSDPEHFELFLLYLYSGEMNIISSNNAIGLYMLADKYNLKELKETCCKYMAREIGIDSFCDVTVLAHLHDETELLEKVKGFFIEHSNAIFLTPKWMSFMAEHTTLANELLVTMGNEFQRLKVFSVMPREG